MAFDPARRLAELVPREGRHDTSGKRAAPGKPRIVVALSGGMDSMVLLTALAAARHRFASLRACHVNHHLSASSDTWSAFCARAARQLRVPFKRLTVKAQRPRGASLEEWAREQRYALMASELRAGEVLVTAQHGDDQAETVLLQLLRGAGVGGLAAMPAIAPFAAGWLARPMLHMPRSDIEAYARSHHVEWVEDDTNADEALARNFLRRRVMPLLASRWPAAATVIARSANHLAEARDLLDERAQADLSRIVDGNKLLVSGLKALQPARRRNALRAWFAAQEVRMPDTKRLAEISGPLLEARIDAHPWVEWPGVRVARVAGRLEVVRQDPPTTSKKRIGNTASPVVWHWREQSSIATLFGVIAIERDPHGPIDLKVLPPRIEIRAATRGERLRLSRSRPSQAVRTLLQTARVPLAERARLPRFWGGLKLLAVGERWLDASVVAEESSEVRGRLTVKSPPERDPK